MQASFDTKGLDPVIHGRMRLGLMAYLASVQAASFAELKARLDATDGNLSTHLRKLEDAGYIHMKKSFSGRRPLTTLSLTPVGRKAWIAYLTQMQGLLNAGS